MKKELTFPVAALCIVGALFVVAWTRYWPRRYEAGLVKIKVGDAKDSVVQAMGRPWKDEACGVYLAGAPLGCAEELYYANPLAPIVPQYWIVDLDSSKHVINTVTLTSP